MRRFGSKATAVAAVSIGILLATTSCTSRERTTVNASDTYLVAARDLLPAYEDASSP